MVVVLTDGYVWVGWTMEQWWQCIHDQLCSWSQFSDNEDIYELDTSNNNCRGSMDHDEGIPSQPWK